VKPFCPWLSVVLAGVSVFGCASKAPSPEQAGHPRRDGFVVTILIFSGRPNPTFVLDGSEWADKFRAKLGGRAIPTVGSSKRGTLGSYQGIRVESAGVGGVPMSFTAHHREIEIENDHTRTTVADDDASMQTLLLDEAVKRKVIGPRTRTALESTDRKGKE